MTRFSTISEKLPIAFFTELEIKKKKFYGNTEGPKWPK